MKTEEDLTALQTEVNTLSKKLAELTEEELSEVTGGLIKPTTTRSWFGVPTESPD